MHDCYYTNVWWHLNFYSCVIVWWFGCVCVCVWNSSMSETEAWCSMQRTSDDMAMYSHTTRANIIITHIILCVFECNVRMEETAWPIQFVLYRLCSCMAEQRELYSVSSLSFILKTICNGTNNWRSFGFYVLLEN